MSHRRRNARTAAVITVAAALPALLGGASLASAAVPYANAAGSATGNLIGTLAYRGAEHPYLVGNLADADKRFGPNSAQAKAADAGLVTNVTAIAGLLSGGSASKATTIRGELLSRDTAEVAYAAAVLAAHESGATGTTQPEKVAIAGLSRASRALSKTIHADVPSITVAAAQKLLAALGAGDKRALAAAALGQPAQFADVEAGSIALATGMAEIGAAATGSSVAASKAVDYRAGLETAFTEHVYQTGLFGEAVLLDGPGSPAAVAARKADDLNTAVVTTLLHDIGAPANARAVWNSHINGYADYLANLANGSGSVTTADKLFAGYESGIAADVHHAVPSLGTPYLKTMFTMHVSGTLTVFHLEKAGSPTLYPTAQTGAGMLASFGAQIAEAQTKITG